MTLSNDPVYKGQTLTVRQYLKQPNGDPANISGATKKEMVFKIKNSTVAALTKTATFVDDGVDGGLEVKLSGSDLEDDSGKDVYMEYQSVVEDVDGEFPAESDGFYLLERVG